MRGVRSLAALALAAVLTAVVAAALAGCGSAGKQQVAGRSLFTKDCGFCHSLTGRQSPTRQGGDLLHLHIGRTALLEFTREMPVRHRMTAREVSEVADYVLAVEAGRRSG